MRRSFFIHWITSTSILLGVLLVSVCAQADFPSGRELAAQKKYKAAARIFIKECLENNAESCQDLGAMGTLIDDKQMTILGFTRACLLGKAESCLISGSQEIYRGHDKDGLALLRRGCADGNNDSCRQLDLLKQHH